MYLDRSVIHFEGRYRFQRNETDKLSLVFETT